MSESAQHNAQRNAFSLGAKQSACLQDRRSSTNRCSNRLAGIRGLGGGAPTLEEVGYIVEAIINSMKHSPLRNPSEPPKLSPFEGLVAGLGSGAGGLWFACKLWNDPPQPPFTGKGALMYALANEGFGPKGPAIMFFAFGAFMCLMGVALFFKVGEKPK